MRETLNLWLRNPVSAPLSFPFILPPMALKPRPQPGMIDINLVPMMDVILTILTFFIIISMTFNNQQALDVALPSTDAGAKALKFPDPMVVGLNVKGEILLKGRSVTDSELAQQMQTYLTQNPNGAVLLRADQKVSYEQLAKLLGQMQSVGGEKVSLAVTSP
jgi:biopolymer transport protein ExbD